MSESLKSSSAADSVDSQRMFEALDTFINGYKETSLVLTFVNSPYLPIFDRWHACFRRCCDKSLLVIALDEHAHDTLKKRNINSVLLSLEGFDAFLSTKQFGNREMKLLSSLWGLRVMVFKRLIDKGIDFIHSDADAFWLDNPLPELQRYDHDLIASIGYGSPKSIVEQWGFVLCMGFFILRSTPSSKRLLDQFVAMMKEDGADDQITMNTLLLDHGVTWRDTDDGGHEAELTEFGVRLLAVSDKLISRVAVGTVKVFHPYLQGDLPEKLSKIDAGIREIRKNSGLKLSYGRRNPIAKTGRSKFPFIHRKQEIFGLTVPIGLTRDLFFVHIPKTGGTSIQELFSFPGRGHLRAVDSNLQRKAYSFAVIRNPYSRLVSAFHYLTDRKNLPKHDHKESAYVAAYGADFKRFVHELVACHDIYRSVHLIPQTFFICYGDKVMVNKLIALERLSEDLAPICRRFGVENLPPKENQSRHGSIESYYDEDTRKIVARAYEEDFRILNYDPLASPESPPVQGMR